MIPGWEYFRASAGIIMPVIDKDSVFVVFGSGERNREPSILARFDRASGKLLWERDIWTDLRLESASIGPSTVDEAVEARIGRDGDVYVFGASVANVYVEAFSRLDGTPRLRFNTEYLQEWPSD
jgi:hypothetical protein